MTANAISARTRDRLSRISARLSATTPGPWRLLYADDDAGSLQVAAELAPGSLTPVTGPMGRAETGDPDQIVLDHAFIADAHEDVMFLIDTALELATRLHRTLPLAYAAADFHWPEVEHNAGPFSAEEARRRFDEAARAWRDQEGLAPPDEGSGG